MRRGLQSLWKISKGSSAQSSCFIDVERIVECQSKGSASLNSCSRRLSTTSPDDERVIDNPKVLELADQIVQLNLLEVSDLTEILRKRLHISGLPAMAPGMMMPPSGMAVPAAGTASGNSVADKPQAEEKAEFNIKLTGFDAASKIKLIKEVRSIMNLGLKEAKETVESAPSVLMKNIKKEEAEQLKAKLESAGATVTLE